LRLFFLENQMAININKNNNLTDDYKDAKIPATQGNVIETLNTYNDELKKKYYDKEQTRTDENALQKSIMTLVKLLDASNNFTGKTLEPKTNIDETTAKPDDGFRLDSYKGSDENSLPDCQDSKNSKNFIDSGLIQRINIISHLLSGKENIGETDWTATTHGNNVGNDEHTNYVPVIGYTRDNPNYSAEITKQSGTDGNGHFNVNINGLNTNGDDNISDKTVLSEKQIADMISQSVYNVLGQYDSRITGILAYLIYHAGNLPESYEYVLGHYYTDEIKKAPLYITYEHSQDEKEAKWSVHDLNGENEFGVGTETEDFWYAKNSKKTENGDITFSKSDNARKWQIKVPELKNGDVLKNVDVYYNDSSTRAYSLPIPPKTFTLNLGLETSTSPIQYKCKFGGVEYSGSFNFSNGMGSVNVPQGADITVTLPTEFDGDLFYKYQYGEATQNKIEIETTDSSKTFTITMENDQEIYAKVLTYTLKNDGNTVSSIQKYYKTNSNDVTFEVEGVLTKKGYSFNGTTLGGTLKDKKITIKLSDIQENKQYTDIDCGDIIDTIKWEPKTLNVTVHYVLDSNKIENTSTYPTDTIKCTVGRTIQFDMDIPDDDSNPNYHIGKDCGYDFVGLYSSTDLIEPPITECPEVNNLTDLYAVYEIKKYKYSLVLNDGSLNSSESTTGIKNWELEKDLDSIPEPTRAGYKFEGWYTDINFANDTKVNNFKNQDATYYAKWEELNYTIEFKLTDEPNENIQPYFKYKSISVKASNFPVTLGEPVAEGYEFNGWKLGEESNPKSTISINDFDSGSKEITLTATWKPQEVTVLEEIYYEMDGDGTEGTNKKYDLVEVRKNTGTVNGLYEKNNKYDIATGFTETNSDPATLTNVSYKGDVLKRYFNRNTYNLTYHNEKANSSLTTTQSFNYSDHNVLLENDPSVPEDNCYTFDCWVDANGKKVTCIPAHTANKVDYYARYNQSAPVQGVDFKIERTKNDSNDTLTIINVGNGTKKLCCLYGNITKDIDSNGAYTLKHADIYQDNSKETVFAWIYFGSEQGSQRKRIIVNESSKVEVPLKFGSDEIASNEYTQNESAGTLEKTNKSKGILEYRFKNDEDNDGEWYELNKPLHVEKEDTTVKLRRKETFDRLCSETVDVTFGKKQSQNKPTIDGNIEVIRKVSIYQPGQIEVKNGAFGNNNGPLQYRIFEENKSSGSAWLNVERPSDSSSVYINVDKECTVYFRYGENAQYLASNSIGVDVDTVMHNVTFHLDEFPSKSDGYKGFPVNTNNPFTIQVKSGSQLYKCDEYINKVKDWAIFGYTPYTKNLVGKEVKNVSSSTENVGGLQDSDRVLKFLYVKVKDDNKNDIDVPFSELNVIDKDLELYMRFTPSQPTSNNWTYTDAIIINDYNTNTPIEIQDSKTLESSNISYGTNYKIDVIQEIKNDTLSTENLISVLNWLDENTEKTVQFSKLTVSNLTNNNIDNDIIINNKLTCSYKDEKNCFNVSEDDTFNYKFTSVFNLQENTSLLPMVQFKVESSNGEDGQDVNGVLENISAYGFNSTDSVKPDFTEFKYKLDITNKLIEFMYKDDPRVDSDYDSITENKIDVDNYNEDKISIFFHSGLVNDKMYPAYKKEKVSIKKISLPNDESQFNSIVFDSISDNGFTLKSGWEVNEVKKEGATNNE